jgi:hypothetical protein
MSVLSCYRVQRLTGVSANGVFGIELVGHVRVVLPSAARTDGRFHETGKRRKDVDGRVDALVVELAINEDLPFSDIPCQIGNGVGDIWRCQLSSVLGYLYVPSLGMVKIGI